MERFEIEINFLSFLFIFFLLAPQISHAKEYFYKSIDVTAKVNEDSTVDITEKITFDFDGEFHKGWRSISLQKLDGITNIRVLDQNGAPLQYSWRKLDKTSRNSWGKYTTYKQDGNQIVEWYYKTDNPIGHWQKTWTIQYKAHGAISFLKDKDELYWNVFTDYNAPVAGVSVTVFPPHGAKVLAETLYMGPQQSKYYSSLDNNIVSYYIADTLPAKEKLTFAVGFEKGFVSKWDYWIFSFLRFYWGFVFGSILLLLSIIYSVARWITREYLPRKNGVIIPIYEPPKDLPPAMMDYVLHERMTKRAWPATIVHLATRGLLNIEEKRYSFFSTKNWHFRNVLSIILYTIVISFLLFLLIGVFTTFYATNTILLFIFIIVIVIILSVMFGALLRLIDRREYLLYKKGKFNEKNFENYERLFINTLFEYGAKDGIFSTAILEENIWRTKTLNTLIISSIKLSKEQLYEDVSNKLASYYAISYQKQVKRLYNIFSFKFLPRTFKKAFASLFVMLLLSVYVYPESIIGHTFIIQLFICAFFIIISGIIIIYSHTDVRLNKLGNKLYREILGFRLYLKTAERYRLQNLTPETFQKFLPYAMVFGVEKKWAKAFERVGVPLTQPSWYRGGSYGAGGFSASAFSSSLSNSFASTMSHSGAGASGGGGGAGGGAGGGGGGAS